MVRRFLAVVIVSAVAGSASQNLIACGDKFLRAGRSQRSKGYAAVYPASILIYKPNATDKGLKEFETLLRKAGHKPVALKNESALSRALSSSTYDVVIADYADVGPLRDRFGSASTEPGFLPILHKPSKAQEAEVAKQFHCLLKPEKMTKYDALDEIDHLMEQRRKGTKTAAVK
jgi:hypothetical protein